MFFHQSLIDHSCHIGINIPPVSGDQCNRIAPGIFNFSLDNCPFPWSAFQKIFLNQLIQTGCDCTAIQLKLFGKLPIRRQLFSRLKFPFTDPFPDCVSHKFLF